MDHAIGNMEKTKSRDSSQNGNTIGIMGPDPIEVLTSRLSMVMAENNELQSRVKALEGKMQSVLYSLNVERNKGNIKPAFAGYFDSTPTPSQRRLLSNEDSMVELDDVKSIVSCDTDNTIPIRPFSSGSNSIPSMSSTMRLTTATSAMGYTNKKSVWGTALASMLIAMVRYYITKTGRGNIMLDET